MHETFVFPMDCKGYIQKLDEKVIINENKQIMGYGSGINSFYDPFEHDELIPAFIEMIEKVLNGANLEKNIKKWVSERGLLYGDSENDTVNKFWEECIKFYKIWSFYKVIANRDKDALMKKVEMEKKTEDRYNITFFSGDSSFDYKKPNIDQRLLGDYALEFDLKTTFPINFDQNRSKFEQIQSHAMIFLFTQIEEYTNKTNLSWGSMKHERKENRSNFKIRPVLRTPTLIDSIYLQFYILFSENEKKICPVCNRPFIPKRKDQKYCSDTCKLTAKSRRYRIRKQEQNKII